MNELTIINHEGKLVADSREVAAMVEKDHKNLMRDIKGYIETLAQPNELNFEPVNFFIESTYQDNKGETRPCYLLTRKGCDMVANKMTGEKGVRFTAAYIDRFYEMEHALTAPKALSPLEILEAQVLAMRSLEQRQTEQAKEIEGQKEALAATNARLDIVKDTMQINPNAWREECRKLISQIAQKLGGGTTAFAMANREIYDLVDLRGGANLAQRVTNKKRRMADEGICKSKRENVNKLDVIADDKRLTEIYIAIVKEYAVKHLDAAA